MTYYIDAEFCEGPQDNRFLGIKYGQTKPTIDLISLAIVAEDGRELYLISKDFNLREAWDRFDWKPDIDNGGMKKVYWIRENVLKPIFIEFSAKTGSGFPAPTSLRVHEAYNKAAAEAFADHGGFTYRNFKNILNEYGKTNKQIAEEVEFFVKHTGWEIDPPIHHHKLKENGDILFYGYYADYDWVVFCWLFGRMIDLPKGFPKYCRDLKQQMDEKARSIIDGLCFGDTKEEEDAMAERSIPGQIDALKEHPNYPKQTNEHSAIHDARWNMDLHNFIKSL